MFQRITAVLFGVFGTLSFSLAFLSVWKVLNFDIDFIMKLLASFVILTFIALVLNITAKLLEKT